MQIPEFALPDDVSDSGPCWDDIPDSLFPALIDILDAFRRHGGGDAGAQAAWEAARQYTEWARCRAPRWDEKLAANTAARRSYTSPLGQVLACIGIAPWGLSQAYGGHSGRWPRTKQSKDAGALKAVAVLEVLDKFSRDKVPC